RTEKMKKYITNDEYEKLMKVYNALPKRETILHGDFHAKNIMLVDEELMFIDMGDVGYGHPLLDLGGSYLALVNIGKLNPDIVEHYTGMNYDLCLRLWDAMLKEYFGTVDIEICKKVIRTFGEAKYALTPAFYTKATDEMAMNLLGRIRKTGILADDYDISFTLENIKTIFGNEE
ncbi:MAG: phosphotransferase, partial [Firmicutes bacterium]|nr:phosphotransferase [Bacillota bacterium]